MLEIKVIYLVLLAEGFGVSLLVIVLMIAWRIRTSRRNRKAVAQLISQIKNQSKIREEKTGSFLQEIYGLAANELKVAVETIHNQEKQFLQKIITIFLKGDTEMVTTMDAEMTDLFDTYKALKPKMPEGVENANPDEILMQVKALKSENEKLREELEAARLKAEDMIGEFGNMFGGGKDHELAEQEVVEKVTEKG